MHMVYLVYSSWLYDDEYGLWFNGYMVIVVYSNQFEWFIPKTFIPI